MYTSRSEIWNVDVKVGVKCARRQAGIRCAGCGLLGKGVGAGAGVLGGKRFSAEETGESGETIWLPCRDHGHDVTRETLHILKEPCEPHDWCGGASERWQ